MEIRRSSFSGIPPLYKEIHEYKQILGIEKRGYPLDLNESVTEMV